MPSLRFASLVDHLLLPSLGRCALLADEADAFEATPLPRRRPNTMNNGGLICNDIGMHGLMTHLLHAVVAPLAAAAYGGREVFARSLDHHHSFFVRYATADGADRGLDLHHDASEVRLHVCLLVPSRAFSLKSSCDLCAISR